MDQNTTEAQRVTDASFGSASTLQNDVANASQVLGDPAELMRSIQTLPREELERLGLVPPDPQFGPRR